MAQATNTQLGEIQLAGDLAGNGGAQVGTNPQLKTMPGLVPGSYIIPRVTVDQKGRITAIANGAADILELLPSATTLNPGIVSVGDNLYVASEGNQPGFWTVDFGGTLSGATATGLSNQGCAMYGFDMQVDHGIVQSISVPGNQAQTVTTLINQLNAKMTGAVAGLIGGNIIITSTAAGTQSAIALTNIHVFACMNGFVNNGSAVDGLGSCQLYAKRGSTLDYGVVKIGNGIEVDNGVISVNLDQLPPATTTTQGGVIVPTAGNLVVDVAGNISVPTASASTLGVVKVGTGLSVTAGALTVNLPNATTSTKGVVQAGVNVNVAAGVISVPNASASTIGVAKIGAGLSVAAGVVSLNIASASQLGAVKGGGLGITVAGDGTISADPVTVPDATASTKGAVQVGSGLTVTAGVLSIADATTSTKGVVQVGSGLAVAAGVLSAIVGNGATKGIVSTADASKITITNGLIDIVPAAVVLTTVANTYTKAQVSAVYDLGSGNSIAPDLTQSNTYKWTPTASATITAPSGAVSGGIYTFVITTPAAFMLTVPANFKFPNGVKPTPSSSSRDIMTVVFDGTDYLGTYVRGIV